MSATSSGPVALELFEDVLVDAEYTRLGTGLTIHDEPQRGWRRASRSASLGSMIWPFIFPSSTAT